MMNSESAVSALAAIAQSSRLAVFRWLVQCGPAGATPGEISAQLDIPPATLSFHLKSLQHAGLIGASKNGRSICYRADFAAMQGLLDYLTENCCGGDAAGCAPTCFPAASASNSRSASSR